MIFFYHLITYIAAAFGLILAYKLRFKIPEHLRYFFFFMGLSLVIHFFFDMAINPKADAIAIYLNFEPWSGILKEGALNDKVGFLFENLFKTIQDMRI